MVPEQYIELPYSDKTWRSWDGKVTRHEPAGVAEIPLLKLVDFYYHGQYHSPGFDPAFIEFHGADSRAVEEAGWGRGATRGGLWPTEEFSLWLTDHGQV